MTENVENLILEHLRALRASLERVENRLGEIENRLTSLEVAVAGIRRDAAHDNEKIIQQQIGLDQLSKRIERIEKRLEIIG